MSDDYLTSLIDSLAEVPARESVIDCSDWYTSLAEESSGANYTKSIGGN